MKQTYAVEWMHCTSCSQIISKQVKKMPWVDQCEVNFAISQAVLDFDPSKQSLENINKTLDDLGYSLHSLDLGSHGNHTMPDGSTMSNAPSESHANHSSGISRFQLFLIIFMVAIVFVMMWRDLGAKYWRRVDSDVVGEFFHHLMPLFATYVFFWIDTRFVKAVRSYIKHGVGNMDSLIGIWGMVWFIYSFIVTAFENVLAPYMDVSWNFYEGIIVVVGLSLVGRYIEQVQLAKNADAIKALMKIQAKDAVVVRDGEEIRIPLDQVMVGDIIVVKPGENIPVDGLITQWISEVNESMITWESLPVTKKVDDLVIGGTINVNGILYIKATKLGSESALSKIIEMVTQAQNLKPSIQKLADTIAGYFIPAVLILATVTWIARIVLWKWVYDDYRIRGIIWFVAIMSIACPCALWLATPLGIINGITRATKHGILVKNTDGLLALKDVKTIIFDKTGTITTGKPTLLLTDQEMKTEFIRATLQQLASLEQGSTHPLATAITRKAKELGIPLLKVEQFKTYPGLGVQGVIDGKSYYAGNEAYAEKVIKDFDHTLLDQHTRKGQTPVILFTDEKPLFVFTLIDTIKPWMKDTLEKLHAKGITTVMCTWDHPSPARFIADQLHIDEVVAQVTPEGKADYIKSLRAKSPNKIAMVGDGINDSIALSLADVSISMSDWSDVSIESSDLILLKGDLNKVIDAIAISKSTNSLIYQNLFRAFSYNIIGIPLAGGWLFPRFGRQLSPVFAGVFMAASSLFVVINSMRGK